MLTVWPSIWPTRNTGFLGASPSASRSAFFATVFSIAARTSEATPKKRSAGTIPSRLWCGLWWL